MDDVIPKAIEEGQAGPHERLPALILARGILGQGPVDGSKTAQRIEDVADHLRGNNVVQAVLGECILTHAPRLYFRFTQTTYQLDDLAPPTVPEK